MSALVCFAGAALVGFLAMIGTAILWLAKEDDRYGWWFAAAYGLTGSVIVFGPLLFISGILHV